MYALKNKHRQVTLQKFLCKSCLKESQRRDGNDQSDGDVPFISIGFPSMSITEDNYNYRMVAQKYQEQLNQKNTTRYHFSINQCTSKTILHLNFYLLIMQYNSGSQRKIPSSSVPLWQAWQACQGKVRLSLVQGDIANLALGRASCRTAIVSNITAAWMECNFLTRLLLFQLGSPLEQLACFSKNLEVTKSFENGHQLTCFSKENKILSTTYISSFVLVNIKHLVYINICQNTNIEVML